MGKVGAFVKILETWEHCWIMDEKPLEKSGRLHNRTKIPIFFPAQQLISYKVMIGVYKTCVQYVVNEPSMSRWQPWGWASPSVGAR